MSLESHWAAGSVLPVSRNQGAAISEIEPTVRRPAHQPTNGTVFRTSRISARRVWVLRRAATEKGRHAEPPVDRQPEATDPSREKHPLPGATTRQRLPITAPPPARPTLSERHKNCHAVFRYWRPGGPARHQDVYADAMRHPPGLIAPAATRGVHLASGGRSYGTGLQRCRGRAATSRPTPARNDIAAGRKAIRGTIHGVEEQRNSH